MLETPLYVSNIRPSPYQITFDFLKVLEALR